MQQFNPDRRRNLPRHKTLWPGQLPGQIDMKWMIYNGTLLAEMGSSNDNPRRSRLRQVTWKQIVAAVALVTLFGVSSGMTVVYLIVRLNQESTHETPTRVCIPASTSNPRDRRVDGQPDL